MGLYITIGGFSIVCALLLIWIMLQEKWIAALEERIEELETLEDRVNELASKEEMRPDPDEWVAMPPMNPTWYRRK